MDSPPEKPPRTRPPVSWTVIAVIAFHVALIGAALGVALAASGALDPALALLAPSPPLPTPPPPIPTHPPPPTPTRTPRLSPTASPSVTPSITPTPTITPSPTITPTGGPSGTGGTPTPLDGVSIYVEVVATGLTQPVAMAFAPGDGTRIFIAERRGTIRIVENGLLLEEPFLDISDRVGTRDVEQGLLGLAFHPDYAQNGYFFVHTTDPGGDTRIVRYSASGDPYHAVRDSDIPVLAVDQPAAKHNGGQLVFGPDGYLYIGLGDGGGYGDQYHNAQSAWSLLGKILRINVDSLPYSAPPGNAFPPGAGLPEIWAMGLRNPWRFSFDRLTGDLYVGDVGEDGFEEVSFAPAGAPAGQNFGWPMMEALHCFPEGEDCAAPGLIMPAAEYDREQGACAVVGGYVYRGQTYRRLRGVYLFADFCNGIIFGMARARDGAWAVRQLVGTPASISSFGEDPSGELYLLDFNGALYRIRGGE